MYSSFKSARSLKWILKFENHVQWLQTCQLLYWFSCTLFFIIATISLFLSECTWKIWFIWQKDLVSFFSKCLIILSNFWKVSFFILKLSYKGKFSKPRKLQWLYSVSFHFCWFHVSNEYIYFLKISNFSYSNFKIISNKKKFSFLLTFLID